MPKFRNIHRRKRTFLGNQFITKNGEGKKVPRSPSANEAVVEMVIANNAPESNLANNEFDISEENIAPPVLDTSTSTVVDDSTFVSFTNSACIQNFVKMLSTQQKYFPTEKVRENRKRENLFVAGYRLIDISILVETIQLFQCPECSITGNFDLRELVSYGSARKISIECSCVLFQHSFWTSRMSKTKGSNKSSFDINKRICYATRVCGLGYAATKKFMYLLNLPPHC